MGHPKAPEANFYLILVHSPRGRVMATSPVKKTGKGRSTERGTRTASTSGLGSSDGRITVYMVDWCHKRDSSDAATNTNMGWGCLHSGRDVCHVLSAVTS